MIYLYVFKHNSFKFKLEQYVWITNLISSISRIQSALKRSIARFLNCLARTAVFYSQVEKSADLT
jgi:hypothetical protein